MRKLPTKATKTHLPEALNLFAVHKKSEDLITSDATANEGDSEETVKKFPISIIESNDFYTFMHFFYEYSVKIKKLYVSISSQNFCQLSEY
jgi:hypothetical protein